MENLELYEQVRKVPPEAQKQIVGGRLKGKTDINPMWRIKTLTEQFGPCGIGWSYEIVRQWLEPGADGEIAAFCNIHLWIKLDGEWSRPIPGTGGSMLAAKEKNGIYTTDECFKMALTDAISVACKALGVGADIYWDKDRSKYDRLEEPPATEAGLPGSHAGDSATLCEACGQKISASVRDYSRKQYGRALCMDCQRAQK